MYEEKLIKLGLSSGESRVYLALLSLGSSSVGSIIKKSSVSNSKIYSVLDRLVEKGLASFIIKENTRYFQALEPGRLNEYLEKKAKEIEEGSKILKEILPYLKSSSLKEDKQGAEIFIGVKGIMTAHEIILNNAQKNSLLRFFYMHNPIYDDKVYDFYYGSINYNQKILSPILKKKKIIWRGITNKQNAKIKPKKTPAKIQERFVTFPVPGNISITNNAILITIWHAVKPLGILVQSEEVANGFIDYFDSIWKVARK